MRLSRWCLLSFRRRALRHLLSPPCVRLCSKSRHLTVVGGGLATRRGPRATRARRTRVTSNRHQDGAFTRSQKEGGASRGSGSALDCGRPEAGGSSSGSVPHVAAANEVHADHGAARVGWGTERARGSPRRKRGRAAEVQGGEVAATGSGQHARCDHTQIDSARPSLISVCDGGGDVGGAQGSAGGGRDAGRGSGVCGAVVPARGRGDPEARVTMASSEVCRQSDCES